MSFHDLHHQGVPFVLPNACGNRPWLDSAGLWLIRRGAGFWWRCWMAFAIPAS